MDKKKTVVIYESFYEAFQLLSTDEARVALFNGMMQYGLTGEEPTFSTPELKLSWTFYKPNMDANIARYNKAVESGRKSSGNKNPKKVEANTDVVTIPSTKVEPTPVIEKKAQPVEAKEELTPFQSKLSGIVKMKGLNPNDEARFLSSIKANDYNSLKELEVDLAYIYQ